MRNQSSCISFWKVSANLLQFQADWKGFLTPGYPVLLRYRRSYWHMATEKMIEARISSKAKSDAPSVDLSSIFETSILGTYEQNMLSADVVYMERFKLHYGKLSWLLASCLPRFNRVSLQSLGRQLWSECHTSAGAVKWNPGTGYGLRRASQIWRYLKIKKCGLMNKKVT